MFDNTVVNMVYLETDSILSEKVMANGTVEREEVMKAFVK